MINSIEKAKKSRSRGLFTRSASAMLARNGDTSIPALWLVRQNSGRKFGRVTESQRHRPRVAESLSEWFQSKESRKLIDELKQNGVKITDHRSVISDQKFGGKIFVLTGTLGTMTRDEAKEKIRVGRRSERVGE